MHLIGAVNTQFFEFPTFLLRFKGNYRERINHLKICVFDEVNFRYLILCYKEENNIIRKMLITQHHIAVMIKIITFELGRY